MSVVGQMEAVRANAGIWMRETHTIVQFVGPDALSWLQSQTTNDVLRLESGQGCDNAMVDRQGRLQAVFSCHRWSDEIWIIIEKSQLPALMQRVETHLILEEVQVQDVGGDGQQILIEGPRAPVIVARLAADGADPGLLPGVSIPRARHAFVPMKLLGRECLVFRSSISGEDGFLMVPAPAEAVPLYADLVERGQDFLLAEIDAPAQRALGFEGGFGDWGVDIDSGVVIAETPYEHTAVNYEKGCYLGQEVVQRLKSYGTAKQALRGLVVADASAVLPEPGAALYEGAVRVGQIRSSLWSPLRKAWLAFAYLDRDHRTPDRVLALCASPGGPGFDARVATLPFHHAPEREQTAREWYEEALRHFEADADDEDDSAIELLREVLILDPTFEDAFEALGVILHRHHRVDEAIEVMKRLERINPGSVMAHSNLSVFYVAKGMIQEAEAEKAKAEHLAQKHHLDAASAAQSAAEGRERIRHEAQERIGMFLEVLEVDPEDSVARMGLGKCYMQLDDYEAAVPQFEAAAEAKKDYSAAYLEWGKCLEFLGHRAEAAAVYARGIEAASRKGDMMPMREMERRAKALASGETGA